MEIKPSVWSNYFSELSPEDRLKEFSKAGFKYIEFSTEDGDILLSRGKPRAEGETYRRIANDMGIEVLQGHLNIHAEILNRSDLEGLKVWLELFSSIGIKNCVLHYGGNNMSNYPPKVLLEKRGEALKELKNIISGSDMRICLENLLSADDHDCSKLKALINYVGEDNMGICLDTGHLNLTSGDPAAFVSEAGTLLHALHLTDNEGNYDQHLMPFFGRGTVPWKPFLKALGASSYNGLFNFEIPGECANTPIEVRRLKLAYLHELTAYMKSQM